MLDLEAFQERIAQLVCQYVDPKSSVFSDIENFTIDNVEIVLQQIVNKISLIGADHRLLIHFDKSIEPIVLDGILYNYVIARLIPTYRDTWCYTLCNEYKENYMLGIEKLKNQIEEYDWMSNVSDIIDYNDLYFIDDICCDFGDEDNIDGCTCETYCSLRQLHHLYEQELIEQQLNSFIGWGVGP